MYSTKSQIYTLSTPNRHPPPLYHKATPFLNRLAIAIQPPLLPIFITYPILAALYLAPLQGIKSFKRKSGHPCGTKAESNRSDDMKTEVNEWVLQT